MADFSDKFPLGVCLWLLKGRSLPDRLAWLVAHGFTAASFGPGEENVDSKEREEAAALVKESGMVLTWHANARLNPDFSLDVNHTLRILDAVAWWHENTNGIRSCCSDPIHRPDGGDALFLRDISLECLRLLRTRLEHFGIRFGLENSFGFYRYRTVADILDFERVSGGSPNLGTLLDLGHANVHVCSELKGTGLSNFIESLPLPIWDVHLSDNYGVEDEHLALGDGNLDMRQAFEALSRRNFDGVLNLEICKDAKNRQYSIDSCSTKETDLILRSRDRVLETLA